MLLLQGPFHLVISHISQINSSYTADYTNNQTVLALSSCFEISLVIPFLL